MQSDLQTRTTEAIKTSALISPKDIKLIILQYIHNLSVTPVIMYAYKSKQTVF